MPSHDSSLRTVVVLGTGGTIAGGAADALDVVGYTAGQRAAQALVGALPVDRVLPAGTALEVEQLAQLDSKDMDSATWEGLARRCAHHLARPEVSGLVITHGTDTLEETGFLLQRVLAPQRPVVLAAAMRPATALQADGPQNLLDALSLATWPGARGVLAVVGGAVLAGDELRKRHPYRLQAFDAGDAGPLGVLEAGRLRRFRPWPSGQALGLGVLPGPDADWPWVEVLSSHALARPAAIEALVAAGVQGLVLAATGNGTVHRALAPALVAAERAGVTVWTVTRCGEGALVAGDGSESPAARLSPWQARVALMLQLASHRAAGTPAPAAPS